MAIYKYLSSIKDKKIAVIGAGVSNMPLVEMLTGEGIDVTVYDQKDKAGLGEQYTKLSNLGVKTVLGDGYLENIKEDIIFRSPGIHPKYLDYAKKRGATITSEMELFFAVCPCPIIAITGSDGKTTTTTLVYEMLKHSGRTCYLGGNIGTPLLPKVREMRPMDIAVVELSSFQLMDMKHSPQIAAITNLTPNHLDYHADFDEYVNAKTNIYKHQTKGNILVLNIDDDATKLLTLNEESTIIKCSKNRNVQNGVVLEDDVLYRVKDNIKTKLLSASEIRIPGEHNVSNIMMAAAIVDPFCSDSDIISVAKEFGGVEHRIEFVRNLNGVSYYNDSIASSPTRTIAGLKSFSKKIILIAGGYDKKIPYDVLGDPICEHCAIVILTGATADKIRAAIDGATSNARPDVYDAIDLEDAVKQAYKLSDNGDIVIMSPASASFDCFKNFAERGNKFKEYVNALES